MERKLIFGVTSSIAAINSPQLVREFVKLGFNVKVILSPNSLRFVTRKAFEDITGNKTYVQFEEEQGTTHIELARFADLALVAPASANFIASLSLGLANNMLLTELLAFEGKLFIAPAMNPSMYHHPTQINYRNILQQRGVEIIPPQKGEMICGEVGEGKMASHQSILEALNFTDTSTGSIFRNKKCLISLGATRAYIDRIRYITNESSGKMGWAIADTLKRLGAQVSVINCNVPARPGFNCKFVSSNEDYESALLQEFPHNDYFFSVAAISDFSSDFTKLKKNKKELMTLPPIGKDYLGLVSQLKKPHQKIIAFSADTDSFLEKGKEKLINKKSDAIFVNPVTLDKVNVFGSDFNEGWLCLNNKNVRLERKPKKDLAFDICKELSAQWN